MQIEYKQRLVDLLNDPGLLQGRKDDIRQIQGEINSLTSAIQGQDIRVNNLKIALQRWIGLSSLDGFSIEPLPLDFSDPDFLGRYYVEETTENILQKALETDTEFKVLELVKQNAVEKKKLAQRGKWDIFFSAGGKYNFKERIDGDGTDDYSVNVGLNIKRFDRNVLKYTTLKAEADILNIETTMEDRRIEINAQIARLKEMLLKKKEQLFSSIASTNTRKDIYQQKKESFINGRESADNFIQAFRALIQAEKERYNLENNYFDIIRDFDYICGFYFEKLSIQLN